MPKLIMDEEEFGSIIYEDHEDFESVTQNKIVDQRRWVTCFEQVFKRKSDNTYWRIEWERGSTESQDGCDPEYEGRQVTPVEKVITVYEVVKDES